MENVQKTKDYFNRKEKIFWEWNIHRFLYILFCMVLFLFLYISILAIKI